MARRNLRPSEEEAMRKYFVAWFLGVRPMCWGQSSSRTCKEIRLNKGKV